MSSAEAAPGASRSILPNKKLRVAQFDNHYNGRHTQGLSRTMHPSPLETAWFKNLSQLNDPNARRDGLGICQDDRTLCALWECYYPLQQLRLLLARDRQFLLPCDFRGYVSDLPEPVLQPPTQSVLTLIVAAGPESESQ